MEEPPITPAMGSSASMDPKAIGSVSMPGFSSYTPAPSSQLFPSTPRAPQTAGDELRLLRAHNAALKEQLALKDASYERLRLKVQERQLMMAHEKAVDIQATRREAGGAIL